MVLLFAPSAARKKSDTSSKPRGNDLDGKSWLQNSISVWSDLVKTKDERDLGHPAMFPENLAKRVITSFTRNNQIQILDPFVGTGSTLVACQSLGKNGWGFDISKEYIEIAKERIKLISQNIDSSKISQNLICDSSINLLKYIKPDSVDLCFTSPPYWDILDQKRSVDLKEKRNYCEEQDNLGQISCYKNFIESISEIFSSVYKTLKPNAYCVVNVMDLRKKNQFYPLHMDISEQLKEIGFTLDDIIIWDRRREYNNLKPLGYPYVFRINKVHEFLMIFQKRI